MKKLSLVLVIAILLAAGAAGLMAAPAQAQVYTYPAPPQNIYATPWVGPNTPWVNYNGDWFLNGVLQYFFGQQYGWAPYYAYPTTYIVRPNYWYGPMWHSWYQRNPVYVNNFVRTYPYWRGHSMGHRYDQKFYSQHHQGHGGGWQKGFHGGPPPNAHRPDPGHGPKPDMRRNDPGHGPRPDMRRNDPGHGKPEVRSHNRGPGPRPDMRTRNGAGPRPQQIQARNSGPGQRPEARRGNNGHDNRYARHD
jgi:hypothetical protein